LTEFDWFWNHPIRCYKLLLFSTFGIGHYLIIHYVNGPGDHVNDTDYGADIEYPSPAESNGTLGDRIDSLSLWDSLFEDQDFSINTPFNSPKMANLLIGTSP
jgi:hypothetical protein